jgi:hypothetical protein
MDYEISRIKHVADYSRNTDIYYEVRVKKKRKKCIKMDDKSQSGRNISQMISAQFWKMRK